MSFDDLRHCRDEFNSLVDASSHLDRYCSATHWVLPAQRTLNAEANSAILALPSGMVALMRVDGGQLGRTLLPLEGAWGFASPLASPKPDLLVRDLAKVLGSWTDWDSLILMGLVEGSPAYQEVLLSLCQGSALLGPSLTRRVASLGEGFEAWLAARSPRFRASLRSARRQAHAAGLRAEVLAPRPEAVDKLLARAIAVERGGWKQGCGFASSELASFYQAMLHQGAQQEHCLFAFLSSDSKDLGYAFGCFRQDTFRGFQLGYTEDGAPYSPGNLCQAALIEHLCARPELGVSRYDLGMDMAYKKRWADESFTTQSVLCLRAPLR